MHLFFDTETNGLPLDYRAPLTDLENWPRMVQLAWLVMDDRGSEIASAEHIIRPDGFVIPAAATRVHGITTEMAMGKGVEIAGVLRTFASLAQESSVLVAHNMAFDEKILGVEFLRAGLPNPLENKPRQCTMRSSTNYCGLPGPRGYKWPTLSELHWFLFAESFRGAHTALADVRACARCYLELKRLGVMADISSKPTVRERTILPSRPTRGQVP